MVSLMDWKNPDENKPAINRWYWLWNGGPAVGKLVRAPNERWHWIDRASLPIKGVILYADIVSPDENK